MIVVSCPCVVSTYAACLLTNNKNFLLNLRVILHSILPTHTRTRSSSSSSSSSFTCHHFDVIHTKSQVTLQVQVLVLWLYLYIYSATMQHLQKSPQTKGDSHAMLPLLRPWSTDFGVSYTYTKPSRIQSHPQQRRSNYKYSNRTSRNRVAWAWDREITSIF